MTNRCQVKLAGFGGQGIILAGTILGHALTLQGKWVSGSSSYGAAARGGDCYYDVVFSDEKIAYPHVLAADHLLVMSQQTYDKYRSVAQGGTILYDRTLVQSDAAEPARHVAIAATDTAIKDVGNKQVASIVLLGAAAGFAGIIDRDTLMRAIGENVPARFREMNETAAAAGFDCGVRERLRMEGR